MSFSVYPKYKDSGVEWLGQIPDHWSVRKLKFSAQLVTEKAMKKRNPVALENVESWSGRYLPTETEFDGDGVAFRPNDILFGKLRPYLAKALLANEIGEAVGDFHVFRPGDGLLPKFLHHQILEQNFIAIVDGSTFGSKMPRASWEDVGAMPLPLPPVIEQVSIIKFLAQETAKIDAVIQEQQRLIELLAERRKSMMAAAVCRGINANAHLVDSGVEWLGKIPEHWKVLQTKRLFRLITDAAPDGDGSELLSIYTDIGVRPRKSLEERGNKSSTTDGYWKVKKGDLIVNKLLAWMGAIGVSEFDGVTSPAYDILRHEAHISPHFYDILFRCGICHYEFKRYSRGIMEMRLRLYFEELGQLHMPCPPLDEQLKIVEHVRKLNDEMDKLAGEASRNITFLTERRASLISAAVTGKIDVRGFVAHPVQ